MRRNAQAGAAQPDGAGEGGRSREGGQERGEGKGEGSRAGREKRRPRGNKAQTPDRDAANTGGEGGEKGEGGQHSVPLPLKPNERGTVEKSGCWKTGFSQHTFRNPAFRPNGIAFK